MKSVAFLGIGGGAVAYAAKYYHHLGYNIIGHDIKETAAVKELRSLEKVKIVLGNPTKPFSKDIVKIIYSAAIPSRIIEKIKDNNAEKEFMEVGIFFNKLTSDYENNKLSKEQKDAFHNSGIAPLYSVDYSKEKYIGITGTDGKTTTCAMIYHILEKSGHKPGMITTIEARIGDTVLDTGLHQTTPSAQVVYKLINKMKDSGCTHIIIESTSHGLSMGRLAGIKFDVAAYTNITDEHLDYHGTWENYASAKSLLITKHLKKDGTAVINEDDKRSFNYLTSNVINKITSIETIPYSVKKALIKENERGLTYLLNNNQYSLPIKGRYNIENAYAAIKTCKALGIAEQIAAKALEDFSTVVGRMNILLEIPFKVIIDFAHTPNALKVALESAVNLKYSPSNKLIVVFGCAGQRDPTKRSPMGKFAKKFSDVTILTAEDPRSENLTDINDQIEEGWNSINNPQKQLIRFDNTKNNVEVRRKAIQKALEIAQEGDVIIITGKGHENSLCFGTKEYDWNDITETKKLISQYPISSGHLA